MSGTQKFRMRLRIRLGTCLASDAEVLTFDFDNRPIELKSDGVAQNISKSRWLVASCGDFDSEQLANEFGQKLVIALNIAGVCTRIGVDVGDNKPTTMLSETFGRAIGLVSGNQRLMPNVHGLMTFPDDTMTVIPVVNASANFHANPNRLIEALTELGQSNLQILSEKLRFTFSMLNSAVSTSDSVAKTVLAFAAIESLTQAGQWSNNQKSVLKAMENQLRRRGDRESLEVARAISDLRHPVSLREGVRQLLDQIKLQHMHQVWDSLYKNRSKLIHGRGALTPRQLGEIAQDAINLSGKIALEAARQEGIPNPTIAQSMFP